MMPDVQHITPLLSVFNMPRSLAFYRDILGFGIINDSGGGDNSSWVLLKLNDIHLMLNDQYEPGSVPETELTERRKWHHDTCLYFACPDVDGMYDYLRSRGVDAKPPTMAPYGMKQLYLHDPDGYNICFQWPAGQEVPDAVTEGRKREHDGFRDRVQSAEKNVAEAEAGGAKQAIADALKELGNILRRPPFTRDAATAAYERAANLYLELDQPLEAAWVKRHIGINHEYAERLDEAEKYYDEALALYRKHAIEDDLDYANAVRYPAVIKNRLGKRDESAKLWEEAHDRYAAVGPNGLGEGVAEAAAWLTIFAIEKGDRDLAKKWFAQAAEASAASSDPDTHKFIAEVKNRLEKLENA